jgi:hypothetical protein
MSARGFSWKVMVAGGALTVLVVAIMGYQYVLRSFIQAYYQSEYRPEQLTEAELGQPPASHRLADVPWLSETPWLCQSISLRMMLMQQGRREARPTIDFLMGFTWGATAIPRRTGFFPGQDPEVGFQRAARYLGFTRRYLTTDSADDFVRALKTLVSKGRAVRVAVDRALLLDQRGSVPHSVVLIGYDADGFEYYEPTCDEPTRCIAMEREPGAPGLKVTTAQLLRAEESQALVFQYPWRYQLMVLEPGSAPITDLSALLSANGRALVGLKSAGPSTGSVAVADTATAIERHGKDIVTADLLRGVQTAALVRRENSVTLRSLFASMPGLAPAAELLDEAGKAYTRAVMGLEANEFEKGVQELKQAAALEREAGALMVRLGADGG